MYLSKEEVLKKIQCYDGLYSLEKYGIKRKVYKIPEKTTTFFFKKDDDFNFWAKEYYMKYADEVNVVKNILEEDNTINYRVSYNINRIDDIFNMHILNNFNNYVSVRGCSIQDILAIASESQLFKNSILHGVDIMSQINIFKELTYKFNSDSKETVKRLYHSYLKENETYNAFNEIICWNYRMNNFTDSMEAVERAYNKRDKILRKVMGLADNVKLKNTSELTLYKIVHDIFPDAIYQYKAEWLGRQSLDIYIPSRKIAFEYQGEQHYHTINFFGGESAFLQQKQRDDRKKNLCVKQGVKLIEWKYIDIPSTENFIKRCKQEQLIV